MPFATKASVFRPPEDELSNRVCLRSMHPWRMLCLLFRQDPWLSRFVFDTTDTFQRGFGFIARQVAACLDKLSYEDYRHGVNVLNMNPLFQSSYNKRELATQSSCAKR